MKVLLNYLGKIDTEDHDLLYLKNLKDLGSYEDIQVKTINDSYLQRVWSKVLGRLSITRFHQFIPSELVQAQILTINQIQDFDIFYSSWFNPLWFGRNAKTKTVIRDLYLTDDYLSKESEFNLSLKRQAFTRKISKFDAVIMGLHEGKQRLLRDFPDLHPKVYILPYFLPHVRAISQDEFSQKWAKKIYTIGFIGRDGSRKNLRTLEKALFELPSNYKQRIKFVCVSNLVPTSKTFKAIETEYYPAINDKSQIIKIMKDIHIFCLPTLKDSYGITFVEAMSQGCVLIGDDDAPRKELIEENQVGVCLDPKNYLKIAECIMSLCDNPLFLVETAIKSRRVFLEKFSAEVVAKGYFNIFNTIYNS